MRKNLLKQKLNQGEAVVGAFCNITSPNVVEVLGLAGLDFVIVDSEHGTIMPSLAENMYRAAESVGVTPVTRIGENSQQVIQKFLDAGSMGIQIPLVNSREDAQRVVDAAMYPPMGKRGLAGTRAASYGLAEPMDEYVKTANQEILVIVQAETVQALDNIKELSQVDGLDLIFMGPSDISSSLGMHGQIRHPEVLKRIEEAGKAVLAAGKAAGTIARNVEEYQYWRERGFQYLCTNAAALMGQAARTFVNTLRDAESSVRAAR